MGVLVQFPVIKLFFWMADFLLSLAEWRGLSILCKNAGKSRICHSVIAYKF